MENWWKSFFDADYLRIWGGILQPGHTGDQVQGIWELLRLCEGASVLDAPCGYGRLSLPMARRGVNVVGVDQSLEMIEQAEKNRGELPTSRLRYIHQDLRTPLADSGFDAAFNVFSSIGYGSEEDDLAIFKTMHDVVRPAGLVLVDTMHRDAIVAHFSHGSRPAHRLADGTMVIEEPRFDPIEGRVETTWYWSGPSGQGAKSASLRIYTVTELIALLKTAGLRFLSAHAGCSRKGFKAEGLDMGGRIGILAERI